MKFLRCGRRYGLCCGEKYIVDGVGVIRVRVLVSYWVRVVRGVVGSSEGFVGDGMG